jgi:ATP/maltotriose-dependent transcriptional regulator MalT
VGHALIAAKQQDVDDAKAQYAALLPLSGTVQSRTGISVDRVLGRLAQAVGRIDAAAVHVEDALAFCRRAGYRPELAWACYDYINLLHEQGQRLKALSLLEEALAISTALGMKPLMERVAALKEQVEAQPSKAPDYPDGLTEREVEVLRLIAAGKTDREIGEALFISLNTVARHISNIFAKTGTSNRAEAASYATRHKLTS